MRTPAPLAKPRHKRAPKPLPLRALYTVTALAKAVGVSRQRMRRLIASSGAKTYLSGKATLIPLTEIQAKLFDVWESIRMAERGSRGEEGAAD